MQSNFLFLLILFQSIVWSLDPLNFEKETLIYSAGFRLFSAGEATLTISPDSLNDSRYILISKVQTNSFLSKFYKIDDTIISWLSKYDLSLIQTKHKIREGNYHKDFNAIIKGDSLAVVGQNISTIPGKVYDPIAFVYFLRKQNLFVGEKFNFFSYGRKNVQEVIVKVTEKEKIKVSAGIYHCFKIEPISNTDEHLLKNNGIMTIWLSDDNLRLPIKITQNTNIGSMVMELKTIIN